MKRIFALTLIAALLLCGCGSTQTVPETTEAPVTAAVPETTEAPTEEPTEPPTEPPPVYFNPLNGEILEEPYTGRIHANTISNIRPAIPHVGVNQADILMEMFVNNSVIRCLALFTDISDVEMIGSTRSTRLMFNDIVQHYDAVLTHAGGSGQVLKDARDRGIDNFNLDKWSQDNIYSVRDEKRNKELGWEHCLMGIGPGILEFAESEGIRLTQPEDKDYFLRFAEDGTPEEGETAEEISIIITDAGGSKKETIMIWDDDLQKYVYHQYDQEMVDGVTGEKEAFRNVIVMFTQIHRNGIYQEADFLAGGEGYFACGGKLIPIRWTCDDENEPFKFWTLDGEVLELGMGNSYIAVCDPISAVTWQEAEVIPETTAETVPETT